MDKRKTLQEIAEEISISRITISKVINRRDGVSEKTRRKVLEALQKNNYKNLRSIASTRPFLFDSDRTEDPGDRSGDESASPNLPSESPSSKPEKEIAVLCVAPSASDFWMEILHSVAREISRYNYPCRSYYLQRENRAGYHLPANLSHPKMAGLIVINVYDNMLINEIENLKLPTVFLDVTPYRTHKALPGDVLLLDGYYSMMEITEQFLRNGHRELGFFGDINYSLTNYDRWRGFKQAFRNYNLELPHRYCFTSSPDHFFNPEEIYAALDRIPQLPRAFICANDDLAYHIACYARDKGLRIPDDLMLAGYDNNRKLPGGLSLTSAEVNTESLGLRLVQQLLLRLHMGAGSKELIYLQPKIYYRESTRSVNPKQLKKLK